MLTPSHWELLMKTIIHSKAGTFLFPILLLDFYKIICVYVYIHTYLCAFEFSMCVFVGMCVYFGVHSCISLCTCVCV